MRDGYSLGYCKNFFSFSSYTSFHVRVWLPVSGNIYFIDNRQLLRASSLLYFDHSSLQ